MWKVREEDTENFRRRMGEKEGDERGSRRRSGKNKTMIVLSMVLQRS